MAKQKEVYLILDNIRSAENVGALFRTADAAGVTKMFLTGTTPTPIDRFGRVRRDVAKASLGAEKNTPWEYKVRIKALLNALKREKFKIIAIEQSPRSVDYKKVQVSSKVAFILGNEVTGIKESTLKDVDVIASIPMRGKKESLNVSVAGGIALFRMLGI